MRQIKRIFIHCTAGPQTQTVEEIQKYWKTHNKWNSPGYHYIIKPDGEIVNLQPEDKPSNGVQGYNSTSINVCYIGGVDKQGRPVDNRTDAQKASLIAILKDLKSRYPDAEILGHREIWGQDPSKWHKMCPCFPAKAEYAHIMDEPKPTEEHVEKKEEPIQEYTGPTIQQHPKTIGETHMDWEEKQQGTRSNIIDFVIQILRQIFKFVFGRK